MVNAEIKFYGRWDLHEKSLVFVTGYDASTGTPQAYVSITGNIAATNVGLVVKQDGDTVLQIDGKYAWNKSTLGWDLAVGYSKSSGLEARLNADAAFVGKKGKLTLKGGATLKKGAQGTDLTFDLALGYSAENRNMVFTLTGGNGSYEIKFSGNVKISGANVTFEITAANKNGQTSVQGKVEFGAFTKNSNLKLALEATLGKNGLQLKADMSFSFSWGPNGPVAQLS